MADEKEPKQEGEQVAEPPQFEPSTGLKEQLATILKLDPSKATNDQYVLGAFNDAMNDIRKAAEEKAREKGLTVEQAVASGVVDQIEKSVDPQALANDILRGAEQARAARYMASQPIADHRLDVSLADAGKAGADVVKSVLDGRGFAPVVRYIQRDSVPKLWEYVELDSADERVLALQRMNDTALLMFDLARFNTKTGSMLQNATQLECWKKFGPAFESVAKAMDTTEGSAWAPTQYSADLIRNVYQRADFASILPRAPWLGGGSTMTVPVEGTDLSFYKAGEPTTDDNDAKYTATTPGLGTSLTVTPATLASRSIWSLEMEEDALFSYVDHVREKMVREAGFALDDAIINGDTTSTHQDTDVAALAASDNRKCFDGIRDKAIADTTTATSLAGAAWCYEGVVTPLLIMDAYGQTTSSDQVRATDTVLLCSWSMAKKLGVIKMTGTYGQPVFAASMFPGVANPSTGAQVASFSGHQVVCSSKVRSDVGSSGYNTTSGNDYTTLTWVYAPAWHIWDKRDFKMVIVDRPEVGQRVLVGNMRLAVRHMYPSTAHTTSMIYGITDTSFNS